MAIINVPCFQYQGNALIAPLAVEDVGGGEQYVQCSVRGRLIKLTPEERVRQAMIWFLLERCDRAAALREYIRFGVEETSLDIVGYCAGSVLNDRFSPSITAAIIETKRLEQELSNHGEQLKTYMLRDRCRSGLLFNGRQAVWLTLAGDFSNPVWTAETLPDLSAAEGRIEQAAHAANAHLVHCREVFAQAAAGNFNALAQLVSLFDEDLSLTFSLSIRAKGSLGLVRACAVRSDQPDVVTYRALGVASRKRQELRKEGFHSLVAVRPGWS